MAVEGPFCPVLREGPAPAPAPAGARAAVPIGDESRFAVKWGPLTLGELRTWSEWEPGGRRAVLCARARSNRVLAAVFSLDSFYEAVTDPVSLRPVHAAHHIVENSKSRDEFLLFDEGAGTIRRWISSRDSLPDLPLDRDVRDVGSAIWWFRGEMAAGRSSLKLVVASGPDLVEIEPGVAEGEERVRTPALGTIACRRFDPVVWRNGRILRRNRYTLWLEAAPPHRLIRLAVAVPGADLHATLVEYNAAGAAAASAP